MNLLDKMDELICLSKKVDFSSRMQDINWSLTTEARRHELKVFESCMWMYELQRFLRDTQNYYVYTGIDCTLEPKFAYSITELIGKAEWHIHVFNSDLYRSDEEALQEGLIKAIQLFTKK